MPTSDPTPRPFSFFMSVSSSVYSATLKDRSNLSSKVHDSTPTPVYEPESKPYSGKAADGPRVGLVITHNSLTYFFPVRSTGAELFMPKPDRYDWDPETKTWKYVDYQPAALDPPKPLSSSTSVAESLDTDSSSVYRLFCGPFAGRASLDLCKYGYPGCSISGVHFHPISVA